MVWARVLPRLLRMQELLSEPHIVRLPSICLKCNIYGAHYQQLQVLPPLALLVTRGRSSTPPFFNSGDHHQPFLGCGALRQHILGVGALQRPISAVECFGTYGP